MISPLTIEMPRGDIRPVRFFVHDPDESTSVSNFDEIYFTVKKAYVNTEFILQKRLSTGDIELKEDGSYQFTIEANDTNDLRIGSYVFDIEVVRGSDIKQTFVGELTLTEEVTRSVNEG